MSDIFSGIVIAGSLGLLIILVLNCRRILLDNHDNDMANTRYWSHAILNRLDDLEKEIKKK